MTVNEIKQALYDECFDKVNNRYQKIKQTITDLDESLAEEAKSGGDDEYDNSRSMMQIDRENAKKQLHEVMLLQEILKKMELKSTSDYVRLGSLVLTNQATYFLSLSIGNVVVDGQSYLCVALNSPIGEALKGKHLGESIDFNNQHITIQEIL